MLMLPGWSGLTNFIARIRYKIAGITKKTGRILQLSPENWKWINRGSLIFLLLFALGCFLFFLGNISFLWIIVALGLLLAMPLLSGLAVFAGVRIVSFIPRKVTWISFAAVAVFFIFPGMPFKATIILVFYTLFTIIFITAGASNLFGGKWKDLLRSQKLLIIFFFSVGVVNLFLASYFLIYPGQKIEKEEDFSMEAIYLPAELNLPDPAGNGNYSFTSFTYGSGFDKQRMEFADSAGIISYTVDGSSFISGWDKLPGKLRTFYWGFGQEELPLNGRIWMPSGNGPFPVVLIVHGNHIDRDFSDTGYDYLGEHLASHGYLAVSADENFLNRGLTNLKSTLNAENDARGWLLLKHLEFLQQCGQDSTSILFGLPDLDNVILVGHSRGGEAVNIAYCFNELPYYPDDASEKFDFHFGIRGIVAIAQVDGQYQPAGLPTPVSNVNYLGLQGSTDADLASFMGLKQYNRISFDDSLFHFKSGIYIEGANHGRFNRSWGAYDIGYPNSLLLNRRRIMDAKDQELIAKVYITAFVKASLLEESAYTDLFRDYRTGRHWLPDTRYLCQFAQSGGFVLADFENNLDLTRGTDERTTISFSNLSQLYQDRLSLNKGSASTGSMVIGWNNTSDSVPGFVQFSVRSSEQMYAKDWSKLSFDLAVLDMDPGERSIELEENQAETDSVLTENKEPVEKDEDHPVCFTLVLENADGVRMEIPSCDIFPLNPCIRTSYFKLKVFEGGSGCEAIPQTVEISEKLCRNYDSGFELNTLCTVTFLFDQTPEGMISLDNLVLYPGYP